MHKFKYQALAKTLVCISLLLSTSALSAVLSEFEDKSIESTVKSRLNRTEWFNLIDYSYSYITKNKSKIEVEENESGFYRINIPAPAFIKHKAEKVRLHYWPINTSNGILIESIHDHPKFFESFIINGGYKHALYNKKNSLKKDTLLYTVFRINKEKKGVQDLGSIYLKEAKVEKVKENTTVVIPTEVIHRVLFSMQGTLSLNVVYKDSMNKHYYNVYISQKGSRDDVKTERVKLLGSEKNSIINEVEKRLLNHKFQRD